MARPEFEPTAEHRRTVALMAAGGMTREKMAAVVGISVPTLDKYFELEMTAGAGSIRASLIEKLREKAEEGNVAAIKAFLALDPTSAGAVAQDEGKKAERQRAAETAGKGTVWEEIQKQH
jgi:hypothetical protein